MASALLRERLPPGFHIGVTQDGRIFFINDRNQSTSWLHPATVEPVLTGLSQKEDLPRGWEEDYTNEGQVFYVDHNRGVTSFMHPFRGDQSHQQQQTNEGHPSSPLHSHQDPSTPPSATSPGSPTLQRDAFKRGTFKQRSVKAPTAKRNPNSEVVKRGWLYRLESGGLSKSKNWKKRWAVLADFALFLYKGEEEASVVSSILLPGYRINPCTQEDNIKRNFVFKVEHENTKSVYLGTEDSPDLLSWMSLLRQASMMNGQTGFQREPNNNYRRYPSKEGSGSNDRPQQDQYGQPQQQHVLQPHDPSYPTPHPHSDYSFQQTGSNYSPSSNPSFQKLQNFRPYNQQDSPSVSRDQPSFSQQGQSPSYKDYDDPASSPMEPHPPVRVGGVYPFIHQQGQRQSYASQGSSNRNSYVHPTSTYLPTNSSPNSTYAPTSSNNAMQYSTHPGNGSSHPDFNSSNVSQPRWQDSLEDKNGFDPNSSRNYPSMEQENGNSRYPNSHHQKPLRDGFAPDSVRSSLAQPEQRYSYNDGRPMDQHDSMSQQQRHPNPSNFNNPDNSQHNYSGSVNNYHPNEPNSDMITHPNLNLSSSGSFYRPNNRMSQTSQDSRQQPPHQFQQEPSPLSSSFGPQRNSYSQNQQRNSYSQNPQLKNLLEADRKSIASTSSAGYNHHHQLQHSLHHPYQHQQQQQQSGLNSSHQHQRSFESPEQINPSSSSVLHSSFSPDTHRINNQPHPHHQQAATSSPSSSTQQDYSGNANPHTYVNFPNRQPNNQQPPPQPPSSLPLQQHHLLPQQHQHNTSRDSSIEPAVPSRPPYPAEMRHQIVEEMAKVATPSTQNDFLISAQINQQRMQQPSYFQYPSPRGYQETKRDTHLQSSQNPNNSFRGPSESKQNHDNRRDGGINPNHQGVVGSDGSGLNASFSRNMMDPEAKKLRAAYERVQNLRSSPDKSNFNDLKLLSPTHRGYKSQDELNEVGKTPPPTGSYHKIRDDSEDLYMRGSAFRPPSSMSGSQAGSDSLMRMKRKFHSTTTMSRSPITDYDKREDLRLVGVTSEDDLSNRDENSNGHDGVGYFNRNERSPLHADYYNVGVNDFDADPWRNDEVGGRPDRNTEGMEKGHGHSRWNGYEDEHPFFDPYGNSKEVRQQEQQDMEKKYQKPILLAAPPRRQPLPIQTVKEDPDMPDRDVLETDLQKIAAKNPLSGPRLRMSISAADLIGKTHDELVLLLIQLRRNQAALDKTRDFYRTQIDKIRPAELEYRRQMHQYGNVSEGSLHNAHRNFADAKTQMEEIENKLEVYRPIINLLDNMVTMGSLYGGDNLMLATQYRKHLLRPDQYQPPKNMLHFTRQNQEDRLIQGTHEDIKQLSKDEVDLEDKIDRLNEVDRAVQEQSFKVSSFKEDKELMERALVGILRQQDQSRNDPREMQRLTQQQRTLEKEISRVTQQLAEASKELEATTAENNKLEHEIALLRTKVHGELSRSRSAPSLASENIRTKMKMEKELAKVQDMMQGLNQKGAKLSQAMNTLRRSSSGANIAAAFDEPDEQVTASGTYLQTDLDSGEQIDLAECREQEAGTEEYPIINHHRQNAADDWDIDRNDEDTKKFFGLLPRDKPKGQTVRDVKRLSEARKEEKKKDDEFGEEVRLRVSNVDNEVSSIIHARIAKDTQSAMHNAAPSVDQTWDSTSQPLYENLPRYGSMPQLPDSNYSNNNNNNNNNQSAASSRRSSIILLTPKPFVPYEAKPVRAVKSELMLNSVASGNANSPMMSSREYDYKDSGSDNNNNNSSQNDYFSGEKNLDLERSHHSQDPLNMSDTRPYHDLDSSRQSHNMNERDFEQNGHFHAKPTTILPKDEVSNQTDGRVESPIIAQTVDRRAESMPGQQGTNQSTGLYAPRPWARYAAELGVKKIARGRYSTISSSQPLKLESSSLINPTLHSSAGDLILNRSIDDIPDIVKSSQGRVEDQLDGDVIDREILSMPDKVLIPERYDAEADAEHLTEDEKMRRQERSERIRRVLTTQSVMSLSQPDISQLPSTEIHSRIQQEKKERAYYLALNQELARQVTQQTQKQAAQRRKTWSGAQFAEAKKQYEQEQETLNASTSGTPMRHPDPVRKRSELSLRNL